jgi:hypothetical protein
MLHVREATWRVPDILGTDVAQRKSETRSESFVNTQFVERNLPVKFNHIGCFQLELLPDRELENCRMLY